MELGNGRLGAISVFGIIKDVKLKLFLDTRDSHNFLSLHDAKSLRCLVCLGSLGSMKLTNGEKLPCGLFVRCLVSFGAMQ